MRPYAAVTILFFVASVNLSGASENSGELALSCAAPASDWQSQPHQAAPVEVSDLNVISTPQCVEIIEGGAYAAGSGDLRTDTKSVRPSRRITSRISPVLKARHSITSP